MGTLTDRILSGGCDPQAVLLFGADSARLRELATRLACYWTGLTPDRLERAVDFQHIYPDGKGMQIRLRAIEETKSSDADKEPPKWIPAITFFRTLPLIAAKKAIWFEQADRLNGDSANAFLKTLEELPGHARVVLTTTEISHIVPTIRSRCLCVPCGVEGWPAGPPQGEMESVWARNPGELEAVRTNREGLEAYWEVMERLPHAPAAAAPWFSEKAMESAKEYAKSTGIGTRESQVHILDLTARWWLAKYPDRPEVPLDCCAVAREILGYANAHVGYDTLFGAMLLHLREPERSVQG